MNIRAVPLGIIALMLAGRMPLHAEDTLGRLMHATSLRCKFDHGSTASWDKGRLVLKLVRWGEGGAFVFDSINIKTGKARLVGNNAAGDVNVLVTPGLLTFIESTPSGNINITSVFERSPTFVDDEFVAVTSRHVDIMRPTPSQYHGTCRVFD